MKKTFLLITTSVILFSSCSKGSDCDEKIDEINRHYDYLLSQASPGTQTDLLNQERYNRLADACD